ncbi:MAG: hypothetical protein OXU74_17155 [Gemmatimonadota bacterium]|nr:hypothetical protein [Gemmatimonadota bacterium]
MNPLPIRRMTHDRRQPPQRKVNQPVRGPVRGELVITDIKPRAVDEILADVPREQDPPPEPRQVRLSRPIRPGEAAPGQQHDAL